MIHCTFILFIFEFFFFFFFFFFFCFCFLFFVVVVVVFWAFLFLQKTKLVFYPKCPESVGRKCQVLFSMKNKNIYFLYVICFYL